MIKTINESDFIQEFKYYNRENQFSYNGLKALFDYLNEIEDEVKPYELDVIGLCCEFIEYENLKEFHKEYNKEDYPSIQDIQEHTQVIIIDDESFIIQQF